MAAMDKLKLWQKSLLVIGSLGLLWVSWGWTKESMKPVVPEGQPCAGGKLLEGKNPWGVVVGSTGFDRIIFDFPALTMVAPLMDNNHQILPRDEWVDGAVTSLGGKIAGRQFRFQVEDERKYCIVGVERVYYRK